MCVPFIAFADDVGLTSTTKKGLEELINVVIQVGATVNMKVSGKKSKVMRLSNDETAYVVLEPMMLETVENYKYLGVQIELKPREPSFRRLRSVF